MVRSVVSGMVSVRMGTVVGCVAGSSLLERSSFLGPLNVLSGVVLGVNDAMSESLERSILLVS